MQNAVRGPPFAMETSAFESINRHETRHRRLGAARFREPAVGRSPTCLGREGSRHTRFTLSQMIGFAGARRSRVHTNSSSQPRRKREWRPVAAPECLVLEVQPLREATVELTAEAMRAKVDSE